MVIVALDVGERRIGVAVSDPRDSLASPLGAVVRRDRVQTHRAILEIVRSRQASYLLIGVPLGPTGEETPRSASIRSFAQRLITELPIPVAFRDERNTTQDALFYGRLRHESEGGARWRGVRRPPSQHARELARQRTDALAATVLLQSYLDELRLAAELALADARASASAEEPVPVPENVHED